MTSINNTNRLFSIVASCLTLIATMLPIKLNAQDSPASIYGYGGIETVVDDIPYTILSNDHRQAFLTEVRDDENKVISYEVKIYDSENFSELRSSSLVHSTGLYSHPFAMAGLDPTRTLFKLVPDENGDEINDLKVTLYSLDTAHDRKADQHQETVILIDGLSGSVFKATLPPISPYFGPSLPKVGFEIHSIKTSNQDGKLIISFDSKLKSNISKTQKVVVSSVVQRENDGIFSGNAKVVKLNGEANKSVSSKIVLPAHLPKGKYKVIVTINSSRKRDQSLKKSFIVKKTKRS